MKRKSKKGSLEKIHAHGVEYVFVATKEGGFWRRKRGTVKKAVLNTQMQAGAGLLQRVSPVSKAIRTALQPYTIDLEVGRLGSRVNQRLLKGSKDPSAPDLSALEGLELQEELRFDEMVTGRISVEKDLETKKFRVAIRPGRQHNIERFNQIVNCYRFTFIMLFGELKEPMEFETKIINSPFYYFDEAQQPCIFEAIMPAKNMLWMICIKVGCTKNGEPEKSDKMRRMMVVDGGVV